MIKKLKLILPLTFITFSNHAINLRIGSIEITPNLKQISNEKAVKIMIKNAGTAGNENETIVLPSTLNREAVIFFFNDLLKNYQVACVGGCFISTDDRVYKAFNSYFFPKLQGSSSYEIDKGEFCNYPAVDTGDFIKALPKIVEVMKMLHCFNGDAKYQSNLYELLYRYIYYITGQGDQVVNLLSYFREAIANGDSKKVEFFSAFFDQLEQYSTTVYKTSNPYHYHRYQTQLKNLTWKLEDSTRVKLFPGKDIFKRTKNDMLKTIQTKIQSDKDAQQKVTSFYKVPKSTISLSSKNKSLISLNALD